MAPSLKKLFFLLVILIFLSFPDQSYSGNSKLNISYDQADRLPMSTFDLYLLSTITGNESTSKAVIKNPISEKISSYGTGETVDIAEDKEIKVVKVFPCLGVVEHEGQYYKIYCKERVVDNSYFTPQSLFGFQVADPERRFYNNSSFDTHITTACNKYGVDPLLVKAVIKAESNFDPNAVSSKNAQGLMQITPPTAQDYDVENTFDPSSNINGGVKILRDLIDQFDGDLRLALAAYNAGRNAVIRYGNTIPPYPETQQYVTRVMSYYSDIKSSAVN